MPEDANTKLVIFSAGKEIEILITITSKETIIIYPLLSVVYKHVSSFSLWKVLLQYY